MCNNIVSKKNNVKLKSKKSHVDTIETLESSEVTSLKKELSIVKKELDDQQKLLKDFELDLKSKKDLINKKEVQLESLKQTIGNFKPNRLLDFVLNFVYFFI